MMNKLHIIGLVTLLSVSALFGQTSKFSQISTDHYRISAESGDETAKMIAMKMEAALSYWNELVRFDLTKLTTKFRVTIYSDKSGFDAYLKRVLRFTRDDYVYIHYSDPNKCELVGFDKEDEKDLDISLLHQGFIQFIRAFIPNVPVWISDGLAAYMENATYSIVDAAATTGGKTSRTKQVGKYTINLNLGLLEAIKTIVKGESDKSIIPFSEFLVIEREQAVAHIDVFYPQAWGFIHFLLMSPSKNNARLLWDSLSDLNPTLSLKDNSVSIRTRIFRWIDEKSLEKSFSEYILASKTFNDLITEGLTAYNENQLAAAKEKFIKAGELKPGHYFPQYYLGLIAYDQKQYDEAETLYQKALESGGDKGLISYALGVNAYANNRYDDAQKYLNDAKKQDRKKYGEKVDVILKQIETESEYLEEDPAADEPTPTPTPKPAATGTPTPEPSAEPAPSEDKDIEPETSTDEATGTTTESEAATDEAEKTTTESEPAPTPEKKIEAAPSPTPDSGTSDAPDESSDESDEYFDEEIDSEEDFTDEDFYDY